jgi:hypothetical protein
MNREAGYLSGSPWRIRERVEMASTADTSVGRHALAPGLGGRLLQRELRVDVRIYELGACVDEDI